MTIFMTMQYLHWRMSPSSDTPAPPMSSSFIDLFTQYLVRDQLLDGRNNAGNIKGFWHKCLHRGREETMWELVGNLCRAVFTRSPYKASYITSKELAKGH